MTEELLLSHKINDAVQAAIALAIERHRKLGESIAIWHKDKVVVLTADQIPQVPIHYQINTHKSVD